MHSFSGLRQLVVLAMVAATAVSVSAQTAQAPQQRQQPAASQPAPNQPANQQAGEPQQTGQPEKAPRGRSGHFVPAARPVKATQPTRWGEEKQQPGSNSWQKPGQPGTPPLKPGQQPPPGQPTATGQKAAPGQQPPAAGAPGAAKAPPPPARGQRQASPTPGQPPPPVLPAKRSSPPPSVTRNPTGAPLHPVQAKPVPVPKNREEAPPPEPETAPEAAPATAPEAAPAQPAPASQPAASVAEQPPADASAEPSAPAPPSAELAAALTLPPSPELEVKPAAPGAAASVAVSAARSGELNPNTYFADWKDGSPVLWHAQNDDKVAAAKQGSAEPDGTPVLVMIPDKNKGWAALGSRIDAKEAGISPGDTILYEVEVRADLGVPMDIRLRLMGDTQKEPVAEWGLPYMGEGVWRQLRMSVVIPAAEMQFLDAVVRLCGATPGNSASVRRASVMLVPPV